jgi:hypothetical protein
MIKFSSQSASYIFLPIVMIVLTTSSASAFLQEDVNVKLRSADSGKIEDLGAKTTQSITGGVDLDLKLASPSLVSLDGRVPMILVPVQPGSSQVNLNPPLIKDLMAGPKQKEIGDSLTEIMMGITSIQKDIQKRDVENASFKLDQMRKKYPDVDFLDFIYGSILLLKGEKEEARKAVARALEAHPEYKDGQDFLKALGGAVRSEKGSK